MPRIDLFAIFDMHCTTGDGKKFIIEVQLADQPFFMERAIYYTSLSIAKDAERGKWNYAIGSLAVQPTASPSFAGPAPPSFAGPAHGRYPRRPTPPHFWRP